MTPDKQILCEFALGFGVPMALAIRELWMLRRDRGSWRPGYEPVPPAPKPLPDCLIPVLPPRAAPEQHRARTLELV